MRAYSGRVTVLVTLLADGRQERTLAPSPAAALAAWAGRDGGQANARGGMHVGEVDQDADGRPVGPAVRRATQLARAATPGRLLASDAAVASLARDPAPGWVTADHGVRRLRDLSSPARLFELLPEHAAVPSDRLATLDVVPTNLPVHHAAFVGREREMAKVGARLADHRLVTLTGAGGGGKTRLAAQTAAAGVDRWPDGAWWVELAGVADSDGVADRVAEVVHLPPEPREVVVAAIARALRRRRSLLVLDNAEHVLAGVSEVVVALLAEAPEVTVLVTSREPLGVEGEAVYVVPPLAAADVVELFVDRGRMVRPGLTLDPDSEAAARRLGTSLDGLPLAIELAAGWLGRMTTQEIEAGLDDRLALLGRGPRWAIPRHQTLTASLDWSHTLLIPAERAMFRRLAVFEDGFDVAAAHAVAGEDGGATGSRTTLARLVDQSLVVADEVRGATRYRLLTTVRAFALAKLGAAGEGAECRDRHLAHFLTRAESDPVDPRRLTDLGPALDRLGGDEANLRAALDWGLAADDPEPARRLAAALPWMWNQHHRGREGMMYLRRAIAARPEDRTPLQARLLTGLAVVADTASPQEDEFDAAQAALELATEWGDDGERALCLMLAAVGRYYTDLDAAAELAAEARSTAAAVGDDFVATAARGISAMVLRLRDLHDRAIPELRETAESLERRHPGMAATANTHLARAYFATGDVARALEAAERARRIAESASDYLTVVSAAAALATVAGESGDEATAVATLEPYADLVDDPVVGPLVAAASGRLALRRGDVAGAVLGFEQAGSSATDDLAHLPVVRTTSASLYAAALRQAGRAGDAGDVVGRALDATARFDLPGARAEILTERAHLAAAAGRADDALDSHHEALAIRAEHGLWWSAVDSLEHIAAAWAERGRFVDAVRLLAAVETARQAMGHPRSGQDQAHHDALLAELRSSFGTGDHDRAYAAGTTLTLDAAAAFARRGRGRRDRPRAGWDSLTPTELSVVRLVVAGLTNPEIGARLFVSRGTVKAHLGRVYDKLQVANRTELATLATGHLADD